MCAYPCGKNIFILWCAELIIMLSQITTTVHLTIKGHGYISIPKRFITALKWKNEEQLFLFLMDNDKIVITNKRPAVIDNTVKDFFKVKLALVEVKTWHVGRIHLKKEILDLLDMKNISLSLEKNENIIIDKL